MKGQLNSATVKSKNQYIHKIQSDCDYSVDDNNNNANTDFRIEDVLFNTKRVLTYEVLISNLDTDTK